MSDLKVNTVKSKKKSKRGSKKQVMEGKGTESDNKDGELAGDGLSASDHDAAAQTQTEEKETSSNMSPEKKLGASGYEITSNSKNISPEKNIDAEVSEAKPDISIKAKDDEQEKLAKSSSGKEGTKGTDDDGSSQVSSAPSLLDSTEELEPAQRDHLYEQGTLYQKKGKKHVALKCYLRCLRGLLDPAGFTYLPQCLHRIADLYYEKEDFQSAIHFIQAEKMYYEAALVDTSDIQEKLEAKHRERKEDGSEETEQKQDPHEDHPEVLRANEYEELARMCLVRKQPYLALEYQAKATKLRQDVYGENHPVVTRSLNFFTVVYGEVGKQQYSESMERLSSDPPSAEEIKKQAEATSKNKDAEKKETGQAVETQTFTPEDEEWISKNLLIILFFICSMLLALLGSYLYCRVYESTRACINIRTDVHYYYMRFKYFYYQTTGHHKKIYG